MKTFGCDTLQLLPARGNSIDQIYWKRGSTYTYLFIYIWIFASTVYRDKMLDILLTRDPPPKNMLSHASVKWINLLSGIWQLAGLFPTWNLLVFQSFTIQFSFTKCMLFKMRGHFQCIQYICVTYLHKHLYTPHIVLLLLLSYHSGELKLNRLTRNRMRVETRALSSFFKAMYYMGS